MWTMHICTVQICKDSSEQTTQILKQWHQTTKDVWQWHTTQCLQKTKHISTNTSYQLSGRWWRVDDRTCFVVLNPYLSLINALSCRREKCVFNKMKAKKKNQGVEGLQVFAIKRYFYKRLNQFQFNLIRFQLFLSHESWTLVLTPWLHFSLARMK